MTRNLRYWLTLIGAFLILVGGSIPLLRSMKDDALPYVDSAATEVMKIAKPTRQHNPAPPPALI